MMIFSHGSNKSRHDAIFPPARLIQHSGSENFTASYAR